MSLGLDFNRSSRALDRQSFVYGEISGLVIRPYHRQERGASLGQVLFTMKASHRPRLIPRVLLRRARLPAKAQSDRRPTVL